MTTTTPLNYKQSRNSDAGKVSFDDAANYDYDCNNNNNKNNRSKDNKLYPINSDIIATDEAHIDTIDETVLLLPEENYVFTKSDDKLFVPIKNLR